MGLYPPRVALAPRTPVFYTGRDGMGPEDHHFRPRFVGVADLWKNFCSGDDIVSSPAGGGSANARLGFSKKPVGLGIPHVVGGVDPGDHRFRPRFLLEL